MLGQCHNSYELFFCKLRLCLFINAVSLDYFLLTHSHEMLINMKKKTFLSLTLDKLHVI